ncbi:CIC11C00000001878 [Sungouiella intermedia]|uniref:CIC11C00000001878 n=1 Tax=Sungouiella intermedia TaxID=45354 RepID=A0A1L0BDH0_9ASCO|nr:CIC11C00000001878 [[Candida] intermedia]
MSTPAPTDKPKPCCVCLDEKKTRDECLLFNGQEGGKCDELIQKYKVCMKGQLLPPTPAAEANLVVEK